MSRVLLLLVILVVFMQCEENPTQIKDQTVIITGLVKDKNTLQPLDDVLVGFKFTKASDSLVLADIADSTHNMSTIELYTKTNDGNFAFNLFLGKWPPEYENMFAYKKGYQYLKLSENDTIFKVKQYTDSLHIYMEPLE